ncbi:DUF1249 domain-containing protein [Shewanella gelidii]|uniref:DUF1249 domain-containing protein n=1 Tax=Shewanella gelidii TaxID=1642821 RepID=A0A917JNV1_9GAMM|nr:DUF1249 domain-containing protein [Shewanella gelidii]
MNSKQVPKKYNPNVSEFLALCGRNYIRILKWLPEELSLNQNVALKGEHGVLMVKLLENTKYTQLVEIYRDVGKSQFVTTPSVVVRVYHDAKLAEVLTSQQIYKLQPVYDYPNLRMFHRDEKYQVNAFLEELLKVGRSPVLASQV